MNFQQLRSFCETVRQGYSLTEVAEVLQASQPGVSRQLKGLEDELGVQLFVRSGRRLLGLTEPGKVALPFAQRLLEETRNLRRVCDDWLDPGAGVLSIAATHTQARYVLPATVKAFCERHPRVLLHLTQGSPEQITQQVLEGDVDLGIATEALAGHPGLIALPCYRWNHAVIAPKGHELADRAARGEPLSLEQLARYPLVSYERGFTGRGRIDEAFAKAGLQADFVLQAMDADVIKTYVGMGLGVGVLASMAYDPARDTELTAIPADHLFGHNTTRVAIRRCSYPRAYVYDFIQTFAPSLTPERIEAARQSHDAAAG